MKDLFHPLAEIISIQDAKSNKQEESKQKFHIKDQLVKKHTNHLNKESKLDEKEDESGKQKQNQEILSC